MSGLSAFDWRDYSAEERDNMENEDAVAESEALLADFNGTAKGMRCPSTLADGNYSCRLEKGHTSSHADVDGIDDDGQPDVICWTDKSADVPPEFATS